jgi:RND superfamily putative drug exporter
MALLGKANWWLPTWLDRALPQVTVEEHEAAAEPAYDAERVIQEAELVGR